MAELDYNSHGFYKEYLNDEFFSVVAVALGVKLKSWSAEEERNTGHQMTSNLTGKLYNSSGILVGVHKYCIKGTDGQGREKCFDVAVRSRLNSDKNSAGWVTLYKTLGEYDHDLAMKYWRRSMNFCRASELEVLTAQWALKDPHLAQFLPNVYHTILDKEREHFIVVTDFISQNDILCGGGKLEIEPWTDERRYRVLKELAKLHSKYLGNTDGIEDGYGGALVKHSGQHLASKPWWYRVMQMNAGVFPDIFTKTRVGTVLQYLDNLEDITAEMDSYPMTFVHNDAHQGKYDCSVR